MAAFYGGRPVEDATQKAVGVKHDTCAGTVSVSFRFFGVHCAEYIFRSRDFAPATKSSINELYPPTT